jgi:hypothetical protein
MIQEADISSISWWQWNRLTSTEKPDMSKPESEKGEQYDLDNTRHYFARDIGTYVNWMRYCAAVNNGFVSGRIWGLGPDRNSFLMDGMGPTTRQPFLFPLMQPMHTRLVAQGSRLQITAKAVALTQRAKSRREAAILKAKAMAQAAKTGPDMAQVYGAMGVTPDENESMKFVEDNFQDPIVKGMNSALTMMTRIQGLDSMKKQLASNVATSGIGVMHMVKNGSNLYWELVDTDDFVWDTNARRQDLADGEFMGIAKMRPISQLCEMYHVKRDILKKLEEAVRVYNQNNSATPFASWPTGMPRVYTCYYRDGKYMKRGFIEGPNGPEMVTVDEINPDTGKPRYTEADLIDPPKNQYTMNWNGRTDTKFIEVLRYCTFIPREYLPGFSKDPKEPGQPSDIVLEHGVFHLQEADPDRENGVRFPIKASTWMNVGGFVVAPLTAAQSPQRVVNQITTDIIWRMSKAPVPALVVDRKAISQGGQNVMQTLAKLKRGEPIVADSSHAGGIPQIVTTTNVGIDPNIFRQFEVLESLVKAAEDAVGLYKDNFGAPGSANQLVGVKQLQLQQANIMQQPFLDAIQSVYEQVHQCNASSGRQFYIRHPWILQDMVGEESFGYIMATKDYELEQFRVSTDLTIDPEEIKRINTEVVLTQLMPAGLLAGSAAAEMLGQSYPEDSYKKAVEYTKTMEQAQQQAAEQQAKAAEVQMLMQEEAGLAQQEAEMYDKAMQMAVDSDKTNAKTALPVISNAAKAMSEVPEPQV